MDKIPPIIGYVIENNCCGIFPEVREVFFKTALSLKGWSLKNINLHLGKHVGSRISPFIDYFLVSLALLLELLVSESKSSTFSGLIEVSLFLF